MNRSGWKKRGPRTGDIERVLGRVLEIAREQLGMDIAWISEFSGGEQVLRSVDGTVEDFGVHAGFSASYEGAYCARVIDGSLPNVVPDARADPRTRDLAITAELGIGAYVGTPLELADGSVYGMLCCISRDADPSLVQRDSRFLSVLARAAAEELDLERAHTSERRRREAQIRAAIAGECMTIVLQPIVDLHSMRITGAEALARFTVEPAGPATWFEDAAALGLAAELELAAMRLALRSLDALPDGVYLSVNASPETLTAPEFPHVFDETTAGRVQLEVTEQTRIEDHDAVADALDRVRSLGVRVAIDDAGAGYAGLRQILRLDPDVIKLDITLTRNIDTDAARQALGRSLVDFAGHVEATIIAEGVETQGELDTLLWLGVDAAQGYYLGRPGPLPLREPTVSPTPRRFASRDASTSGKLVLASSQASTLEALVRPLLEAVVARTGLESSYLAFKDDERSALDIQYVFNGSTLIVPEPLTLEWSDSLCNRSHEQGLLWTADVATDLPGSPTVEELDLQTFLSVPIRTGRAGRTVGTLCAVSRSSRYLGAADIAEVQSLAALVAERLSGEA